MQRLIEKKRKEQAARKNGKDEESKQKDELKDLKHFTASEKQ